MFTTVLVFGTLDKKFRQFDLRNVSFFSIRIFSGHGHVITSGHWWPHESCDMTMTLNVKIYVHILYHCLWKGYDLSDLSHHRLGFRQEKSLIDQWNSMFLNGFDLEISITLILLNNLQCLQPSLSLDSLWFWLKHESVLLELFWTPYIGDDYSILS